MDEPINLLPGQALSKGGRPRLDYRAVATLAFPFMLNSAVQAVLNATDTWFIGRVSPAATAAIGAVLAGAGFRIAVRRCRPCGANVGGAGLWRSPTRASQATWTALWAALFTVPPFFLLAIGGSRIFAPFGLPQGIEQIALTYWYPRMLGGPLGVAVWAILGFFNGIGRPTVTLRIFVVVAAINALFNQLFMFNLGMGVAGSAWATNAAQLLGVVVALIWFLNGGMRTRYRSHLTWRFHGRALWRQVKLGFPMGLLIAADIPGLRAVSIDASAFGTVDGASTQIVMMLTSFCYMPAVGIAMAGTTLVTGHRSAAGLGVQGRQRNHPHLHAVHRRHWRAAGGD